MDHKKVFKNNKVVAMGIQGTKVVIGHDKLLTLYDFKTNTQVFEKKPEKVKTSGAQDFSFVALD